MDKNEDWNMEIVDLNGNIKEITMKPGEILMIEGGSVCWKKKITFNLIIIFWNFFLSNK